MGAHILSLVPMDFVSFAGFTTVKPKEGAIEWAERCPGGPHQIIAIHRVQEVADFPADVQKAAEGFEEMQRTSAHKETI